MFYIILTIVVVSIIASIVTLPRRHMTTFTDRITCTMELVERPFPTYEEGITISEDDDAYTSVHLEPSCSDCGHVHSLCMCVSADEEDALLSIHERTMEDSDTMSHADALGSEAQLVCSECGAPDMHCTCGATGTHVPDCCGHVHEGTCEEAYDALPLGTCVKCWCPMPSCTCGPKHAHGDIAYNLFSEPCGHWLVCECGASDVQYHHVLSALSLGWEGSVCPDCVAEVSEAEKEYPTSVYDDEELFTKLGYCDQHGTVKCPCDADYYEPTDLNDLEF